MTTKAMTTTTMAMMTMTNDYDNWDNNIDDDVNNNYDNYDKDHKDNNDDNNKKKLQEQWTIDNNAIICLQHYYDHMCCTRNKSTEIPRCEPITSLG